MSEKEIIKNLLEHEDLLEDATPMGAFHPNTELGLFVLCPIAIKFALVHGMVDQSICAPKMKLHHLP